MLILFNLSFRDLTADLICQELDFVKDWFTLGYPFLYDSQRIKDAVINVPVEIRRKKLMEVWLESDDQPSWETIARIVEYCFPEHEERADKIRAKYLPKVKFRHPGDEENKIGVYMNVYLHICTYVRILCMNLCMHANLFL